MSRHLLRISLKIYWATKFQMLALVKMKKTITNKLKALCLLFILGLYYQVDANSNLQFQRVLSTGVWNNCIVQDKEGLLWIGTWGKGLLCYDGRELKQMKGTLNELATKAIPAVFVDREGVIWFFVLDDGLYSYNKTDGSYNKYKPESGNPYSLTGNRIYWLPNIITEDNEGLIWIGTADGLNSFNKKTSKFTQYKNDPNNLNSLSNNNVWTIFIDSKNMIWIGTEDGLNCYDKFKNKFISYKNDPKNLNSISSNFVTAVAEDSKGNLWVGTKGTGMDKLDRKLGVFTHYRHDPKNTNGLADNEIYGILVDKLDNLWICYVGGSGISIYNCQLNQFQKYGYNPEDIRSLSSDTTQSFLKDRTGTIWAVDYYGGIDKCVCRYKAIDVYSRSSEASKRINSNVVFGLYEGVDKKIWMGTFDNGLCCFDPQTNDIKNFKPNTNDPLSLPCLAVFSIIEESKNKIWLGVDNGFICLFDTDKGQVIKKFKNPYSADTPRSLTKDGSNPNIIWFATYFSGLFKLDTATGEFVQYRHSCEENSVSSDTLLRILQDGDFLWVGTRGGGLNKFNKASGEVVCYQHNPHDKNSISDNIVASMCIDSRGNFWITTDGGGLNKIDRQTEKFTHYGTECGFPSYSTKHILEDNDGHLWISTDSGIVKFDTQKLKVVKLLTKSDGLSDNNFNIEASMLKDSNSDLWFATLAQGLCKFNPEEANKIESNRLVPPIVLSSFKSKEGTYNESGIKKTTDIKLSWPDNSFEFTFAALDYANPEKNQYAYKLEGFDKDWKYIGTKNFGQYSNINPGKYTLRLKGSNNDGVWNEEGISIKITIQPPFWMTLWFNGAAELAILFIVGGVFLLRIRSLKKKTIYTRNHMIADITAQVAHDIRSPLAALSTALKDLKELPEHKRILIRNATRRISDIANNLLGRYKVKENENTTENMDKKDMKAELVSSLLDSLVSEKRIQIMEKLIEIALDHDNNTRSCFVNLEPEKFKRMISNLINNASEAIEKKGVIRIVLTKQDSDLIIKIIDNGRGIPEDILPKIKQGGVSIGKKGGFGLGISGAIQNIKKWDGFYDIESKVGEGTTFTIKLPIAEAPDWFQSAIIISPNTHIIVLDDDESIHNIWQTHLPENVENRSVTLDHFYEPSAFTRYCETSSSEHDLFLVDYELVNSKETGLDLIEQLNLKTQAILVTSRYEETEIRERIRNLGIKIIPKSFAPYIPISIVNKPVKEEEQPELIFIDDDKTLTEAWEMQASFVNKKIAIFNRSEDFKDVMERYNKNIPIYIDSDLKEEIPGEVFAKVLYEQGFQHLYLATGYEKDRFGDMPWIRDVVTKETPF